MANRATPTRDAVREARHALREIGRELRLARVSAGLRQADVARRAGSSAAQLSRLENGHLATASFSTLVRIAAAVGMRLHVRAYPGGRRVMDAAHLALLQRFRARLHSSWTWRLEVPIPRPGDLRAVDAVIAVGGLTIAIEAITRLVDVQAQLRAAQLKARDVGADRVILLVSATTANREVVRAAGPMLRVALPAGTRAALAALAAGKDPGADALTLL